MAVNSDASRSPSSNGRISEDCLVRSMYRTGLLLTEASGGGAPFAPQVMDGTNITTMAIQGLSSIGIDPAMAKFINATSARFGGNATEPEVPPQCSLQFHLADARYSHRIDEITSIDFLTPRAVAVTESGVIFGDGQETTRHPDWIPWILSDSSIKPLNFIGKVIASHDDSFTVGLDLSESPREYGLRWQSGVATRFDIALTTQDGTEYNLFRPHDVNSHGIVAGSIGRFGLGNDDPATHAAVILPDGDIVSAPIDRSIYGSSAKFINSMGLVLVEYRLSFLESDIYLWNLEADTFEIVSSTNQASIIAIAFDDRGMILGQARDSSDRIIAVVKPVGKPWEELGTSPGYASSAMSPSGVVIGTTQIDGLKRPWLLTSAKVIKMLPYPQDHHCVPSAINSSNQIIGSVFKDQCCHAVNWTTRTS